MRNVLALIVCLVSAPLGAADAKPSKIDPGLAARLKVEKTATFLVLLESRADLSGAPTRGGQKAKGAFVVERLRATATSSQADVRGWLEQRGVAYRSFWIVNALAVRGDDALAAALAGRSDVVRLVNDSEIRVPEPIVPTRAEQDSRTPDAVEWNIVKVNADDVWALGFTGQGVVVGGQDTGYDWDHPALKSRYRGWNGSSADHAYNWHDAIHSGTTSCGVDSTFPCDDGSHGTHTMGTMVGDGGTANTKIGMAPGAKWIGCRNMLEGIGTVATYTECFQWLLAPTDAADQNPDSDLAPQVINNSWGCPFSGFEPDECTGEPTNVLQSIVETLRTAGIVVVVSAGNDGSGCGSVDSPPAIYDAAFSVGATDSSDVIASFSSRGPVTVDASNRLKPDISAPGVTINSSVPGTGYSNAFSGTSMAGPHVAGAVALLLSAHPSLAGEVDLIEHLLTATAVPRPTASTCGGTNGQIPNNVYGSGRLDALALVQSVIFADDFDVTGDDSRWQ